jgi:hypothetical protein
MKFNPLILAFLVSISYPMLTQSQEDPYVSTLLKLCNTLINTQISDTADPDHGALVCPSKNPDSQKIHSRAAEAMYPLAIAFKHTGNVRYKDAAIKLGNWLVSIQEISGEKIGGWSEDWPDPEQKNWYGTTTDQLISLAGAYSILKPFLSKSERSTWNFSMEKAADFIVRLFPIGGNINYSPTGAATLLLTHSVSDKPKMEWLLKADTLMIMNTLPFIDRTNLLTGEGMGIDGGYNIAQSIGYIALYGILKKDEHVRKVAADLLVEQFRFVYPNGSVDNSWGTRSFKWLYESGTKTAPGVYFSFALLADMDPRFNTAGLKCLDYLNQSSIENGWITYGPHAGNHETSSPPCNYSTFARAQSLALAAEYGRKPLGNEPFPAQELNWYRFFPSLNLTLVRTKHIMATISAYGAIGRYKRAAVSRGGSITNLWFEGFGKNGFLQSSSTGSYQRLEQRHMPIEKELLPLTPRIEFGSDSTYFSNIFEEQGKMTSEKKKDHFYVRTDGKMRNISGLSSNIDYTLVNMIYDDHLCKEYSVNGGAQAFQIVEPIVCDKDTRFRLKNDSTVLITNSQKTVWELRILNSTVPYTLSLGIKAEQYWSPFPGVDAFPILIKFNTNSKVTQSIKILIGKSSQNQLVKK